MEKSIKYHTFVYMKEKCIEKHSATYTLVVKVKSVLEKYINIAPPVDRGMCEPMNDRDYYTLMVSNSKGETEHSMVATVLKYYPELRDVPGIGGEEFTITING